MNQSSLANSIESVNEKIRYDASVKKVLANKYILAWILKYTAPEFGHYDIETIKNCIESTPEVASTPVWPGLTNKNTITGISTENTIPNEGKITFDIRFFATTPQKEHVKIIINVEAQNNYYPGYDLVTRGIFYGARQLSAQLDTEFTVNTDDLVKYDNLKKVYSIWICMKCPKYAQNTITSYDIKPTKLYGNFTGKSRYDLMSVVMVCLNDDVNSKESSELIRMLTVLLANEIKFEEKKQILEKFNIPMTADFGKEVAGMCNLSEGVMKKGIQEGLQQGIVALVESLREVGQTNDVILNKLMEKFSLSETEAKLYL